MSNLTIDANNVTGAQQVQIRYRPYGSEQTYTEITISASQLPYSIQNIANGRYEVGVRKKCGGIWSAWSISNSEPCASPIQFSVSRSGSNFVVVYKLAAGQEKFQIEVIDPNNGKTIKDFTGTEGTVTFAISPFVDGEYGFKLRGICDDTVNPVYATEYTDRVSVVLDSGCVAPVLSSSDVQASDANTQTRRLVFTSFTANVRIRVVDDATGTDYLNVTEVATGTRDIVLLKNKDYTVFVYNQCTNNQEQATSVAINTDTPAYTAFPTKWAITDAQLCSLQATEGTVYTEGQYTDFVPGIMVYTDAALTTPLSGQSYILSNVTGKIALISQGGMITSTTNTTCS